VTRRRVFLAAPPDEPDAAGLSDWLSSLDGDVHALAGLRPPFAPAPEGPPAPGPWGPGRPRRARRLLTAAGIASAVSIEMAQGAIATPPPEWRLPAAAAALVRRLTPRRPPHPAPSGPPSAAEWLQPDDAGLAAALDAAGAGPGDVLAIAASRLDQLEAACGLTVRRRDLRRLTCAVLILPRLRDEAPPAAIDLRLAALDLAFDGPPHLSRSP
jgi:hypothetical protein